MSGTSEDQSLHVCAVEMAPFAAIPVHTVASATLTHVFTVLSSVAPFHSPAQFDANAQPLSPVTGFVAENSRSVPGITGGA